MHPYEFSLRYYNCSTFQELYSKLEFIAESLMGLEEMPFPMSALVYPPENKSCSDVLTFLEQCLKEVHGDVSNTEAIKLVRYLKENPPKESFENPKLPIAESTKDERDMMTHIFYFGIDLPGSKHNPFGHLQYFSSFFIDMFFGNYTEFIDHVKSLPKKDLQKAMKKREGHCQFNPTFAPILGLSMVDLETKSYVTSQEKQTIRTMYSGCNENKHLKILKKLIKLGADVNAHCINGFTPLHYALQYYNKDMVSVLLQHGADPNAESRDGWRPLSPLIEAKSPGFLCIIDKLLQYNAKLTDKKDIDTLRISVETNGSKDLAVRVRDAHPREKGECEKCAKPAVRMCAACGLVYYCTPACQKLDWKIHKVTCQRKSKPTNEVD